MLFSKAYNIKLYFVNPAFDFAQGDCQTERSPRLNGRAGKSVLINNSTII